MADVLLSVASGASLATFVAYATLAIAGQALFLHSLAALLPFVCPDSSEHFTGVRYYEGNAIWGLAMFAAAGLASGIGIMFAWMKSGQN